MADLFALESARELGPPDGEERRALVALSLVPGVGPGRVRNLLAAFGSARAVLRAPAARLVRVDGVGRQTAQAIRAWDDRPAVDAQFRRAEAVGARLVAIADPEYPALLRQIYDPPSHLWVLGRLTEADDLGGGRRGHAAVQRLRPARRPRRSPATSPGPASTVVSGLAYGIDVAAHRAALDAGGRTVAVLGSGVDRVYPSRHAPVVRQILDRDAGAVVSEFPLGAAPDAVNFPRRNRIVSGMSRATVVAEAFETGGALLDGRARARTEPRGVRRARLGVRPGRRDEPPGPARPGGAGDLGRRRAGRASRPSWTDRSRSSDPPSPTRRSTASSAAWSTS